MNRHWFFLYAAVTALFSIFTWGCGGEEVIPDTSGLIIQASRDTVVVDDGESVSFQVYYNGVEVTDGAKIMYTLGDKTETLTSQPFTISRPGLYNFFALYDYKTSNTVTVNAVNAEGGLTAFYRRVCVMQFTGTWCSYCPNMGIALKNAMKDLPDRIEVVACHCNDEYSVAEATTLQNHFNIQGFPSVVVDGDPASIIGTSSAILIKNAATSAMESRPAVCGIAIESACEGETIEIDVKAKFTRENDYRIGVALVEDSLIGSQNGVSGVYTHMNTLRAYLTDVTGDDLGNRIAGEEYRQHYSLPFNNLWVKKNTRVVVYILAEQTDGQFLSNNIATCYVTESIPYQYENN